MRAGLPTFNQDHRGSSAGFRTATPSRPGNVAFHYFWHLVAAAAILCLALKTRHLTHVIITIRSSSSSSSEDPGCTGQCLLVHVYVPDLGHPLTSTP